MARAVLADLMCVASEGIPHGYLADSRGALKATYLAGRCAATSGQFRKAVEELLDHGRLHQDGDRYFIKRMVRDEERRSINRSNGSRGGNPALSDSVNPIAYPVGLGVSRTRVFARPDSDSDSSVVAREGSPEGNPLYAGYAVFVEIWQKPCECCEMQFPCLKVDLGGQQWILLVDTGRITMETLEKPTAGLVRYRASREWHKDGGNWVPAVPSFLGWSKDGRPAEPLWNDHPVPFRARAVGEY